MAGPLVIPKSWWSRRPTTPAFLSCGPSCLESQTARVGRVHTHGSSRASQGQRGSPPARKALASRTGWEGAGLQGCQP